MAAVPVLCIGYTAETLDERCRYLGQNGYEVYAARSGMEAQTRLREMPFSAVVIGPAIPEGERLAFIQLARVRNPRAVVVLLYRDNIRRAESAHAVLSIDNGPASLVHALRELLAE